MKYSSFCDLAREIYWKSKKWYSTSEISMNAILFLCVFRNYALLVCHSICIHTKICLFLAYIVTTYCTPWANTWIGLIVEQKSHHHSLYAIFSFENWTGIAYIRVCPLLKREYLCNSSLKWPHWIVGVNA